MSCVWFIVVQCGLCYSTGQTFISHGIQRATLEFRTYASHPISYGCLIFSSITGQIHLISPFYSSHASYISPPIRFGWLNILWSIWCSFISFFSFFNAKWDSVHTLELCWILDRSFQCRSQSLKPVHTNRWLYGFTEKITSIVTNLPLSAL